jgi:hypothetical protein
MQEDPGRFGYRYGYTYGPTILNTPYTFITEYGMYGQNPSRYQLEPKDLTMSHDNMSTYKL